MTGLNPMDLLQVEPEAKPDPKTWVAPDYTARSEARHAKLKADHEAAWGPPGRGCGCRLCRQERRPRDEVPSA